MKVHIEALIAGPLFRSPPGGGGGIAGGADMVGMTKMCTNASRNIQQQRTLFGSESSVHCKRIFEKVKTGVAIHLACSKCGVRVRVEVEVEVGK